MYIVDIYLSIFSDEDCQIGQSFIVLYIPFVTSKYLEQFNCYNSCIYVACTVVLQTVTFWCIVHVQLQYMEQMICCIKAHLLPVQYLQWY